MKCPFCSTALIPTDMFCPHCKEPVARARAMAIDAGPDRQRREFMERQPPRLAPPAQHRRVRFNDKVDVFRVDRDAASVAARKGNYLKYCRKCDTDQPMVPTADGTVVCCPACHHLDRA